MADNSKVIQIGLFAGAGFLAYKYGYLSFLGLGTPSSPAAPAAAAPAAPAANAPTGTPAPPASPLAGWTLDKMKNALAANGRANEFHTADEWNWYLMQAVPNFTAPDPGSVFGSIPSWTRDTKLALIQYWIIMSGYLSQNQGLSGVLRGLAGVTFAHVKRRRA